MHNWNRNEKHFKARLIFFRYWHSCNPFRMIFFSFNWWKSLNCIMKQFHVVIDVQRATVITLQCIPVFSQSLAKHLNESQTTPNVWYTYRKWQLQHMHLKRRKKLHPQICRRALCVDQSHNFTHGINAQKLNLRRIIILNSVALSVTHTLYVYLLMCAATYVRCRKMNNSIHFVIVLLRKRFTLLS